LPVEPAQAGATNLASEPQSTSGKRRVSMSVINFWIDATILGVLVLLGWEAAVLKFLFPAPTMAAGWSLWGLDYNQWDDIRFATLCAFALAILIHVMMHWNWVCSVLAAQILKTRDRPDEGKQTIYGVGTLIVLLHLIGIGVIIALFFVRRPPAL
jgi:hypothetical protein